MAEFDPKRHWKYRAIEFSQGNQTLTGQILIAACGRMPRHAPALALSARINIHGHVIAGSVARGGQAGYVSLGKVEDFNDKFRRLADLLHFTDTERLELFDTLRLWIGVDERARREETLLPGERDK